jgi:hypothetical protein
MSRTRTLILAAVAAGAMALSVIAGASAAGASSSAELAGPDVPRCLPPDCYYV